jgi:putative membrane protein
MMWGYGGWGALWMLLFWAGVIALIIWAVRGSSGSNTPDRGSRAIEILEERYARGEIDRDEFQARRAELERS